MDLYDAPETELKDLDIDVPCWISQDIDTHQLAAIIQGGCASGAYMPAVTYHQALATMSEHGDRVFTFLEDTFGELPTPAGDDASSWAGIACFYLSEAVEAWAAGVEAEVQQALDERAEEEAESEAE